jgi:hypothetical protein
LIDRSLLPPAAKACYEHVKAFSQDAKLVSLVTIYKTVFTFQICVSHVGMG